MLRNTFCHIPGIGLKTERLLWEAGVRCWEDACEGRPLPLPAGRAKAVLEHVEESRRRLDAGDARHFAERLPSNQHWRMFPDFRRRVAYVDIETTGLGGPGDYITVIGLYDGSSVRQYVHGQNLEEFAAQVADFDLIVTYNGKQFDIPFIRRHLGLRMHQAHVDLRYVLHSLGYKGGLKGCERRLGIDRGELDGIDGYFAVLLWHDYRHNRNPAALETLLAYNAADVVNLETLMVLAYNLKARRAVPADVPELPVPARPELPFRADRTTVERLRREHIWL